MSSSVNSDLDSTTWQTKFIARNSQDADSRRTDNFYLLCLFAIVVSSIFATTFIWSFHGKVLNRWLGDKGILIGWLLIAVVLSLIIYLMFFSLLELTSIFFVDLYHPSDGTDVAKRIQLRLFGIPPVPPPLDNWLDYPFVMIKDGKVEPKDDWITWLGGPVKLVIFDGNAAYVERGNRFSRVIGPASHLPFLDPSETVKAVVDLRPQVIMKYGAKPGGVTAWTKDGIRVRMDVRMECQIGLEGLSEDTSKGLLYPYGPISVKKAVERMAVRYDQEKKCLSESDWADGVWGQVQGKLASYVFSHTLDELFLAEKAAGQLQSHEVVAKMIQEMNERLIDLGSRLISLQITNIAPVLPDVNAQRIKTWEAEKQSATTISNGQADAYRILAEEKAHAEAERDLIAAITDGLRSTDPSEYDKQLVLSLSGILDQSLNDTELSPYIPGETLDSLKKLRELLHLP